MSVARAPADEVERARSHTHTHAQGNSGSRLADIPDDPERYFGLENVRVDWDAPPAVARGRRCVLTLVVPPLLLRCPASSRSPASLTRVVPRCAALLLHCPALFRDVPPTRLPL